MTAWPGVCWKRCRVRLRAMHLLYESVRERAAPWWCLRASAKGSGMCWAIRRKKHCAGRVRGCSLPRSAQVDATCNKARCRDSPAEPKRFAIGMADRAPRSSRLRDRR